MTTGALLSFGLGITPAPSPVCILYNGTKRCRRTVFAVPTHVPELVTGVRTLVVTDALAAVIETPSLTSVTFSVNAFVIQSRSVVARTRTL